MEKNPEKDQGIVVSHSTSRLKNLHLGKPQKIILIALLAAVLMAAFAGLYKYQQKHEADVATKEKAQYIAVADKASDLRRTKDYTKAANSLEAYASETTDVKLKTDALTNAGTYYESEGNYSEAIKKYYEVEKLNPGPLHPEYRAIARSAEALRDYKTALTYYQKTLDAFPKTSPTYPQDVKYFQNKIKYLEGKVAAL